MTMRRPQVTLRALLVATLVVAAFFGGIHFEREGRRRQDQAAADANPAGILLRELDQLDREDDGAPSPSADAEE